MLRINLGSGQRKFASPMWTNVDCQEKWSPDVVADGAHMPMFQDNSADTIVLHHVLEHFGCGEGMAMLQECYRVLAPGGKLIITVPDMRALVKGWVTGRINEQIFMTNVYGAYMGDEADRHKWGLTSDSLEELLRKVASWTSVADYEFESLPGSSIAQDWWILAKQAVK